MEALRRRGRAAGCSGARTCGRRGASSWPPARARRWPSAARRSTAKAEAGHQDPCEALRREYRGQRLAGLAHKIFLKLLKAKREVPGAAERQKTLARCAADGLTAGTCELDHVVRQAFAGSVQTLQALCGDCHSEKTLRERAAQKFEEPRGPRVMEYARSPLAQASRR